MCGWLMTTKSLFIFFFFALVSVSTFGQFKLYEKGHDSYTAGKYQDAIASFSQYLTKGTRDKALDVEVFYLRALSYYKTRDFKNAIPDFEETILLDHDNKGNIYWFMAKCYEQLGNTNEALASCNNALREFRGGNEAKAKLYYDRSLLHTKMGQYSDAYADLKLGSALHPGNADIKNEIERFDKQKLVAHNATNSQPVASAPKNDEHKDTKPGTEKEGTRNSSTPPSQQVSAAASENDKSKQANVVKEIAKPENRTTEVIATTTTSAPAATVANSLAEFYKDEKRFALVIGNSNYPKSIGALKNPVNDATDFAKELQLSNFDVQLLTNATYGQMRAAMLKFKEKVDANERDKTVALFYFAGHGLQHEDENYLVPIDAAIEFEDDIARYCFAVQRMVLSNMERSNSRMNIVILDACRNNPFPALTRSAGAQGLGELKRARGSFMAFATAPGSVASDGLGRNGLYTQELIKAVRKPGLTIEQVFKEVRANVLRLSGNRQNTWDSSNIIGEFYFRF
jgi:tetratricopeptide (TPR) repeat protein